MKFSIRNNTLNISRYPNPSNKSLKPWSAVDEYMLSTIEEKFNNCHDIIIYNDRFGFLTCCLSHKSLQVVINNKSQEKAIRQNLDTNKLTSNNITFISPLDKLTKKPSLILLKIPKSLKLYHLFLSQIVSISTADTTVICGFMTKYFSPQYLSIAARFFEKQEQSLAWKKSRLLTLRKPKVTQETKLVNELPLNDKKIFKQYYGVFSSDHIDYASQFLIEHIIMPKHTKKILDLASGNGVLAYACKLKCPNNSLYLLDDSFLAIESSKLNLQEFGTDIKYCFDNNLESFEDAFFDYVISNPPFHFEHEISTETSRQLFKEVYRCLKPNGSFQLVANRHLNYSVILKKLFKEVSISAQNEKFIIYNCKKVL